MSNFNLAVDPISGLVDGVTKVSSPNFNSRPPKTPIDLLVIHCISLPDNQFTGKFIETLFSNEHNFKSHPQLRHLQRTRVSAHALIKRCGTIIQFVPFSKMAWHAGVSMHDGQFGCNRNSIGIELEGAYDMPFCEPQYDALAELTKAILAAYPKINAERIVGHSDIAPIRKIDPGPFFDWDHYFKLIEQE